MFTSCECFLFVFCILSCFACSAIHYHIAYVYLGFGLVLCALYELFACALTEPGIIPRNPNPPRGPTPPPTNERGLSSLF